MSARRPAGGGVRRECRCARSRHVHGTVHAYRKDGCRCQACTAANTRAVTAYRMGRPVRSIGARMVDAAPVRRVLRDLVGEGWSLPQIAAACGWRSAVSVQRLLDARPGRAPATVMPETVEHVGRGAAALRADVAVLSMSATPIPRTLEMAVSGIREMSILQTPPEERQPVLTFVGAHTDAQVSAAIRRELLRDGQVFYVHNRVDSINSVAARVQSLVPEARVRVAHGKLGEHQLEAVIQDFWNHEFDVLVCTTIVETGLDISNANTLIVDRANVFGLSQLHQLRGRVGRGRERAYAYFFYPGDKALTQTAHERLKTIAANTDLGAGLAVAQRDLEIRGAGNLLGGAQSGHVEGVGFDLYVRMVSDAVAAYRGEAPAQKADVRLDLAVDAHIPEDYVRGERLRLEVYAKIAAVSSPEQEADVREELADRYGPLPAQVDLLFAVARLREVLRRAGIGEAVTQGKYLRVSPVQLRDSQAMRLKRLHPGAVIKAAVRQVLVPLPLTQRIGGAPLTDGPLLEWVETLVTRILTPFRE